MFSSFSWPGFGVAVIIIVILYYSVVLTVFFRYDIMKIVREGLPKKDRKAAPVTGGQEKSVLFSGVNDLLEELKTVFEQAASRQYHREELLQALRSTLKNYRQLKDTPFEEAAGQHIVHSAESLCNITLDGNDVKRLW